MIGMHSELLDVGLKRTMKSVDFNGFLVGDSSPPRGMHPLLLKPLMYREQYYEALLS